MGPLIPLFRTPLGFKATAGSLLYEASYKSNILTQIIYSNEPVYHVVIFKNVDALYT